MVGEAVARVRAALIAQGRKIQGSKPGDFMAQCPAHGDGRPSLHVSQGGIGAVLNCFAGCSADAIVSALALTMADLRDGPRTTGEPRSPRYHKDSYDPERPVPPAFTAPDEPADDEALPWAPAADSGGDVPGTYAPRRADAVAEYPYFDETGTLRVVVVRTAAKDFPCYVPSTCQWSLGTDETAKRTLWAVPYNLPSLTAGGGVRGRTLFVVEGEKDVHALGARGLYATTRLGSASEWVDELSAALEKLGALQVVVIEDRDRDGTQAGAKKAANTCESLRRVLPADVPVKRVLLPPVVNGYRVKDAADYFAAGGNIKALRSLVDAAPSVPTWLDVHAPRADVLLADPYLLAPPPVVVPRLAWRGRVTLLAAEPKAGKSTIVGQAVAALTTGSAFLGEQTIPGRVLWFALDESEGDTLRRLTAFGFNARMVRITREVPTPETMQRFVAEYQPALVVVDALSDVLQAARLDENKPEVGQHIKALCVELAYQGGAAFVLIHHTKKGQDEVRGSGAIAAKVDVIVTFTNPKKRPTTARHESGEQEETEPDAPEPRRLTAKGRGVRFGITLQFDGMCYGVEKSPASDSLRVLHVLLNHPEGMSGNAVASLVGGQRSRVLKLIREHEEAGLVQRTGGKADGPVILTGAGRGAVEAQHPDLAGMHFPTLPPTASVTGSRDDAQEMQREPVDERQNTGLVPSKQAGTSAEPVGNQREPVAGTDGGLFGAGGADWFPSRTPRGVHREPAAGTDLIAIDGWGDDDAGAAA